MSSRQCDADCTGTLDFFDIDPFLLALFNPAQYQATFCGGDLCAADVDDSGLVDFFDIDPFLTCLFRRLPVARAPRVAPRRRAVLSVCHCSQAVRSLGRAP